MSISKIKFGNTTESIKDANAYVKPSGGIPKTDLASAVQTSLGKADSALQAVMVETTWANLKSLRDNSQLIPGRQYRITDFVTTTTQYRTQSAGHQFDVIVTADAADKLNEEARAIKHSGDTYFANSNLEAWKIWYCLDNDTTRFTWADSTNGKGVIYRMIDERNNDCPYDFKNIQFMRPLLLNGNTNNEIDRMSFAYYYTEEGEDFYARRCDKVASLLGTINEISLFRTLGNEDLCVVEDYDHEFVSEWFIDAGYSGSTRYVVLSSNEDYGPEVVAMLRPETDDRYFYTFTKNENFTPAKQIAQNDIIDHSLGSGAVSNNTICHGDGNIPNNVFIGTCNENTLGFNSDGNTLGGFFQQNTIGYSFRYNTTGSAFRSNIIAGRCIGNIFGPTFLYNTIEDGWTYNILKRSTSQNQCGSDSSYNIIEEGCSRNIFGYGFGYNMMGNYCQTNTFGVMCSFIVLGNHCRCLTFGTNCHNIRFGTLSSPKDYCTFIIVENGNQYIYLSPTGTTSSAAFYQNVKIAQGVNNTNSWKTITDSNVGQTYQTVYQPANSQTISV